MQVGDAVAGHYHSWLRSTVSGPYENAASPTQFGSRKHRSTALASHIVKGWLQWHRLRSSSAGVVFIDAISAFAAVLRELVLDSDPSEEHIAYTAARLNWTAGEYQEFKEALCTSGISALNLHPHVLELL